MKFLRVGVVTIGWVMSVATAFADLAQDVDQTCNKTLHPPAATSQTSQSPQIKLSYCQAAKGALEGAHANDLLWKVWGVVASVCTYACAANFVAMPSSEFLCSLAEVGGGITDSAVTREFTAAMTAIMYAGMNVGPKIMQAVSVPKEQTMGKDWGACFMAAHAAMTTFQKFQNGEQQRKAAQENLELAKKEESSAVTPSSSSGGVNAGFHVAGGGGSPPGAVSPPTDPAAGVGNSPAQTSKKTSGGCAGIKGADAIAKLNCATTLDSSLPPLVQSPKLKKEFENHTGHNLDDFLNKKTTPSESLAGLMSGNSLNAKQSSGLSALVDKADQLKAKESRQENHKDEYGEATYARGGGGGAPSASAEPPSSGPDLGEMMNNILGQFGMKKGGGKELSGSSGLDFRKLQRGPASIFGDIKVSLFDRVTARYRAVEVGR